MHPSLEDLLTLTAAGNADAAVRVAQACSSWLLDRAPRPCAGEPYGRLPLHRDARGELMLAGWQAGERCAPHDHGQAHGIVIVIAGRFTETRYARRGAELVRSGESALEQGAAVQVPQGLIHDMRCDAAGATLHVYLPSIERMRVYDLAQRTTWIVGDDAGAWLPRDTRHVLAVEAWSSEAP